jgi:hypothetical protein
MNGGKPIWIGAKPIWVDAATFLQNRGKRSNKFIILFINYNLKSKSNSPYLSS